MTRKAAGVDIGSVATKAVVCDLAGRIIASAAVPTGWDARAAAERALREALGQAGLTRHQLAVLGATGYGRHLVRATATATEITCQARGVHALLPSVRTIIDIGGQDSKVIRIDASGNALDFALNDKCAAGTGRFIEVMARALDMTLDQFNEAALSADRPSPISSTCTVFAESEVVGLISRGEPRQRIAAGLCRAIARQVAAMAIRLGLQPPVGFVGGVAKSEAVRRALEAELGCQVSVPPHPQLTAALGACLTAIRQAARTSQPAEE